MQKEFDKAKKAKLVEDEKKKGYRYQTHFFFFLNVPAKPKIMRDILTCSCKEARLFVDCCPRFHSRTSRPSPIIV
jgi:hypothetical protein